MESPRSHQVHPSTWGRDPANHPDGWYFLNSPLALQYRVCPRNIHIFAHLLNINSMQVSEPLHSWPLRPHRKCPQKGRENAAWRQPILQSPLEIRFSIQKLGRNGFLVHLFPRGVLRRGFIQPWSS
ncbi:hypothetical protein M408DRAFT_218339 [Serendipita vermifera MAFF 305830]|uniref:Uncharacterized protein n=1 Tax=Serendipita vermifera MAFF 305830 TaxID=933852 RepID=A0A0C2XU32_SERVB|nr:hypothetical protein M408DRAFT_218339 [Serendipita vermifera MAFF 305830]